MIETAGLDLLKQRNEQQGLELRARPTQVVSRPAAQPQHVLWGHLSSLAVVIAQFHGIGAIRINDDQHVEAAAAGAKNVCRNRATDQANPPPWPTAHDQNNARVANPGKATIELKALSASLASNHSRRPG